MAKHRSSFGASVESADKKPITKESFRKALHIFRFVVPYRGLFGIGMVFLVLSQITAMSFPLLIGQMTAVIEGKSAYTLNQITIALVGVLVFQSLFSFCRIYFFTQVSERSMRDVRQTLYAKIISLPIPFFEKNRVGELMSRITSDITQLQDVLSITLAEFFRQIFTLLGGVVIISFISWKLTVFMLATFPLLVVAAFIFGKYIRKISKKVQDQLAQTNIIVEETLQSIQVVKAFTNEAYETSRYSLSQEGVVQNALKAARFRGAFVSFIIFALFGAIVGIIWYGAKLVNNHEMILAELLTFIIYTAFIGGSVGGLGDMYAQLQRTLGSSSRILEILEETSENNLQPHNTEPVVQNGKLKGDIAFQNIHFAYPSRADVQVLNGLSISVKAGEKIALVGHSGVGKSTIVQLLMRYYQPQSGEILIDSLPLNSYNITDFRQHVAIVPQEVMLFGGTILENIAYGKPRASNIEIIEAARQANALEFIESFPEGFETMVGERGIKLSGGQRQRIAIARAILKNPAILILDEATSSLDAESERLVQEALDTLMQNRTTLIIAHRLATIRNVDTIYVLQNGEVTETGTHDELLLRNNGIYSNLVKLQFELEV